MLSRFEYLDQRKKDGDIVTVEWNRILSPAEDEIVTDQLNYLHYCINEERKKDDDNKHDCGNKEEDIWTKIPLLL